MGTNTKNREICFHTFSTFSSAEKFIDKSYLKKWRQKRKKLMTTQPSLILGEKRRKKRCRRNLWQFSPSSLGYNNVSPCEWASLTKYWTNSMKVVRLVKSAQMVRLLNVNFHHNIYIKTYLTSLISKTKSVMCFYKCTIHQTILQINYIHRICPRLDGWALNTGEDCKTGSIFSTLTTVLWLSFAAERSQEWTLRCDGG